MKKNKHNVSCIYSGKLPVLRKTSKLQTHPQNIGLAKKHILFPIKETCITEQGRKIEFKFKFHFEFRSDLLNTF